MPQLFEPNADKLSAFGYAAAIALSTEVAAAHSTKCEPYTPTRLVSRGTYVMPLQGQPDRIIAVRLAEETSGWLRRLGYAALVERSHSLFPYRILHAYTYAWSIDGVLLSARDCTVQLDEAMAAVFGYTPQRLTPPNTEQWVAQVQILAEEVFKRDGE